MLTAAYAMDPARYDRVYDRAARDRIERLATPLWGPRDEPAVRADPAALTDVDVLCTGWGAPVLSADLLDAAPRLRLVLYAAGSIRRIATDAFWDRGIPIVSAFHVNARPVAEFTVAQICYALKRGWQHVLAARTAGRALPRMRVPGAYGSTVGLLSLGAIGRMVAERLRVLDVTVLAHDPYVDPAVAADLGVTTVGLTELFERSDVLSVHTPLLPATRGLVGRDLLRAMPSGATLVNTSRGAVLDEPALVEVLTERPDLFAALDVTDPEPPVPGSPLFTLPNVVVTPHIAGSVDRECGRLGALVADELERYAAGEPLRWSVDRAAAARMA
ncbi:hydroxyacid dehydrogenase [Actinocatenispora rupis]|uniref:2-hydroxyacid dehydrogenase n=1 Tax=Actinocatenispora rupis TaxID=519421 RepID=A0A8J3J128_9ACTN|nr:hydroxyacid dehydrogenase [Actinocatenispora rupis]GID12263.1 2-hydroxyacid dehydrogenase [Actinocatenispora rupis]